MKDYKPGLKIDKGMNNDCHWLCPIHSLAVVPQNVSEVVVQNENVVKELSKVKEENEEMKESNALQWWRKKWSELSDERERMRKEMYEAKENLRGARKTHKEEEDETLKRGADVARLRRERNEWTYYHDELTGLGREEFEREEFAHETRSETSAANGTVVDPLKFKISRKEADKINVPNWPRIHQLEFWKSQVSSKIVAASGDLGHDDGHHGKHRHSRHP